MNKIPADPSLNSGTNRAGAPLRLPEPARLLDEGSAACACKHLLDKNEAQLAKAFSDALANSPHPNDSPEILALMLIRDTLSANLSQTTIFSSKGHILTSPAHSAALFGAIEQSFAEQMIPLRGYPPDDPIHKNMPVRSKALHEELFVSQTGDPSYRLNAAEHPEAACEALRRNAQNEHLESFLLQPTSLDQKVAIGLFRIHSPISQSIPQGRHNIAQTLIELCFEPSETGLRCAAWLACQTDSMHQPFARHVFEAARQSLEMRELAKLTPECCENPSLLRRSL